MDLAAKVIDRYREQYLAHGHDPATAYVGSGSGGLFLADTTERAVREFCPVYEGSSQQVAEEVIPLVHRDLPPTTLWTEDYEDRAAGFTAVERTLA